MKKLALPVVMLVATIALPTAASAGSHSGGNAGPVLRPAEEPRANRMWQLTWQAMRARLP